TEKERPAADPQALAKALAGAAQNIRTAIQHILKPGVRDAAALKAQQKAFRDVLIDDLSDDQFADMFAQTICYGLFSARCLSSLDATFTRATAAFLLPDTNPFLQRLFIEIAGPSLDPRLKWAVDRAVDILSRASMAKI